MKRREIQDGGSDHQQERCQDRNEGTGCAFRRLGNARIVQLAEVQVGDQAEQSIEAVERDRHQEHQNNARNRQNSGDKQIQD